VDGACATHCVLLGCFRLANYKVLEIPQEYGRPPGRGIRRNVCRRGGLSDGLPWLGQTWTSLYLAPLTHPTGYDTAQRDARGHRKTGRNSNCGVIVSG